MRGGARAGGKFEINNYKINDANTEMAPLLRATDNDKLQRNVDTNMSDSDKSWQLLKFVLIRFNNRAEGRTVSNKWIHTLVTVSYTHLDVYKRQE